MAGEADRCTPIHVGRLIKSTQAAQNRHLPHTYTAYTTTQQVGRLGFSVCWPLQPCYHRKKNRWPWVWGFEAHKGDGLPWYSVIPYWGMCPQYTWYMGNVISYTQKRKVRLVLAGDARTTALHDMHVVNFIPVFMVLGTLFPQIACLKRPQYFKLVMLLNE